MDKHDINLVYGNSIYPPGIHRPMNPLPLQPQSTNIRNNTTGIQILPGPAPIDKNGIHQPGVDIISERNRRYDVLMPGPPEIMNPAILVIDSRYRNDSDYPNINKYKIKFNKPYKDVIQIQLVTTDIPNSLYNVDEYHNLLHISHNGSAITAISITPGNYAIADLTSALQTALNNTFSGYTVTVSSITKLITITNTTPVTFTLYFQGNSEKYGPFGQTVYPYKSNSIGPIIGFDHSDYEASLSGGSYTVTSPFIYNLKICRYLILNIKGLERTDSWNSSVQDCFCILTLDQRVNNFNNADDSDSIDKDQYIKYFPQPIPELNELNIELLTDEGNPCNFHGRNHVLVFQIYSLTRTGAYVKR